MQTNNFSLKDPNSGFQAEISAWKAVFTTSKLKCYLSGPITQAFFVVIFLITNSVPIIRTTAIGRTMPHLGTKPARM